MSNPMTRLGESSRNEYSIRTIKGFPSKGFPSSSRSSSRRPVPWSLSKETELTVLRVLTFRPARKKDLAGRLGRISAPCRMIPQKRPPLSRTSNAVPGEGHLSEHVSHQALRGFAARSDLLGSPRHARGCQLFQQGAELFVLLASLSGEDRGGFQGGVEAGQREGVRGELEALGGCGTRRELPVRFRQRGQRRGAAEENPGRPQDLFKGPRVGKP